jgi:hypothetical protein
VARTTVAELENKLDQLVTVVGALAEAKAPQAKTEAKAKASAPEGLTRNLDPEMVAVGDHTIRIAPSGSTGLYTSARLVPVNGTTKDGKPKFGKSFSAAQVAAIIENGEQVLAAIDTVEQRAAIGQHAPDAS